MSKNNKDYRVFKEKENGNDEIIRVYLDHDKAIDCARKLNNESKLQILHGCLVEVKSTYYVKESNSNCKVYPS